MEPSEALAPYALAKLKDCECFANWPRAYRIPPERWPAIESLQSEGTLPACWQLWRSLCLDRSFPSICSPFSWVFQLGWEPLGFQTYNEKPFSAAASLAPIFPQTGNLTAFSPFLPRRLKHFQLKVCQFNIRERAEVIFHFFFRSPDNDIGSSSPMHTQQ